MKVLVIGGRGQGKAGFVRARYAPGTLADGESCPFEEAFSGGALDKLHLLIRRLSQAGLSPESFALERLGRMEDWIVICDEVGAGVVPVEEAEREWRECVGRLCCELARRADVVERLCCGLPQRLKG